MPDGVAAPTEATATPGVAASYAGFCALCGWHGVFSATDKREGIDHKFPCDGCGYFLRFRDEAQVLIDEFGDGRQLTLDELVETSRFRSLAVYHVGSTGPIRRRLRENPNYCESKFDPTQPPGADLGNGFTNQDLQGLSYDDESFDLVFSSHVMEHIPDPWRAFEEIHRVLRPGGVMIHSIPTRFTFPGKSQPRATLENGTVIHHMEEQYHNSPEGEPVLVFTLFGADLPIRLEAMGFAASMRRPHLQVELARRNMLIVGRRLGIEPDVISV
ncbi:MAG: class I SAM-dependent methyltransferase [Actinomycetota bacterium]